MTFLTGTRIACGLYAAIMIPPAYGALVEGHALDAVLLVLGTAYFAACAIWPPRP